MDLSTIIQVVVFVVIGLVTGSIITMRVIKRKVLTKGRDDTKVASETGRDVIQTRDGDVKKTELKCYAKTFILNLNVDPKRPVPDHEKDRIKHSYREVAEERNAPQPYIDHIQQVAEASSGSFGKLSRAITYVSGTIAEATGSEENEVAQEIIQLADLENYFQFEEGWVCTKCQRRNYPDARFCSHCGEPRDS